MHKILKKTGILLIVFLTGMAVSKYTTPAKTIVVEKEVVKEKKDVVTIKKRIVRPDGTRETEVVITDKTTKETENDKTNLTIFEKPKYKASLLAGYSLETAQPIYGLNVEKRLSGPVFIGVWGTNEQRFGLSLGLEF